MDGSLLTAADLATQIRAHALALELDGRYTDARDLARQADRLPGDGDATPDPTTAQVRILTASASCLAARGRLAEADSTIREALRLAEASFGRSDPETAEVHRASDAQRWRDVSPRGVTARSIATCSLAHGRNIVRNVGCAAAGATWITGIIPCAISSSCPSTGWELNNLRLCRTGARITGKTIGQDQRDTGNPRVKSKPRSRCIAARMSHRLP